MVALNGNGTVCWVGRIARAFRLGSPAKPQAEPNRFGGRESTTTKAGVAAGVNQNTKKQVSPTETCFDRLYWRVGLGLTVTLGRPLPSILLALGGLATPLQTKGESDRGERLITNPRDLFAQTEGREGIQAGRTSVGTDDPIP